MRFSRRHLLVGLALYPAAAFADLYDDFLNSTSKQPFVSFRARGGFPGHAFVGIGTRINANLIVYERLYGFYPAEGGKLNDWRAVFGKTTGAIDLKWKDLKWDVEFVRYVDDERRQAALKVAEKWAAADPGYSMTANDGKNCNSFAAEVAKVSGLKAPPGEGSTLPLNYVKKMKELND